MDIELEPLRNPHERERLLLATYGMPSRESRGREHEEPASDLRTPFQRDRDRIIHCAAFRRLEYKTQVFVNHEGDHFRTRLTHTLEVSQIARALARGLGLNEDLVEAIALSHDVGHPPFGHAGEEMLDALMQDHGGFNHNRQSLRIVTRLERRYPGFDGLNLSWEVREAMAKHAGATDNPDHALYEPELRPTLEAQLVDACDSLAYSNHDIDDGLRAGSITLREIRGIGLWGAAEEAVRSRWPGIEQHQLVARTVSRLIDAQIMDLLNATRARLEAHSIHTVEDVRTCNHVLVAFSDTMQTRRKEMRAFLFDRLYEHPHTLKMTGKGKRFIAAIFEEYRKEPRQLPAKHYRRCEQEPLERVICDYIAGMTDRYCNQEYARLFAPFAESGVLP